MPNSSTVSMLFSSKNNRQVQYWGSSSSSNSSTTKPVVSVQSNVNSQVNYSDGQREGNNDQGDLPKLTKKEMMGKPVTSPNSIVSGNANFHATSNHPQAMNGRSPAYMRLNQAMTTPLSSATPPPGMTGSPPQNTSITVPTVLDNDIQHLLMNKSEREGYLFLQGMVLDLMREVDQLTEQLGGRDTLIEELQEERDMVYTEYRNNTLSVLMAIKEATGCDTEGLKDQLLPSVSKGKLPLPKTHTSVAVVGQLTQTIERLKSDNTKLTEQLQELQEKYDDVAAQNYVRLFKIDALEEQFRNLNKSRTNLANKLTSPSSDRSFNTSCTEAPSSSEASPTSPTNTVSRFSLSGLAKKLNVQGSPNKKTKKSDTGGSSHGSKKPLKDTSNHKKRQENDQKPLLGPPGATAMSSSD